MDCELCLEEFNNQEHLPKVLAQCGHTFCEKCVMQLWNHSSLQCPVCRQKSRVANSKDLPQTNYTLSKLHCLLKEQKRNTRIADKYRIVNPRAYLEVNEFIVREHAPFNLKLYGIYDDELIYKEYLGEAETAAVRQRLLHLSKYCFNRHSFFTNWLMLSERTRFLWFYRKFTMCRHKYSCPENMLRTVYSTFGVYLLARTMVSFFFRDQIADFLGSLQPEIRQVGIFGEVLAIVAASIYQCWRCMYSSILEALSD